MPYAPNACTSTAWSTPAAIAVVANSSTLTGCSRNHCEPIPDGRNG